MKYGFTTVSGVRLIAAVLGDGCLDKRYRLFYANSAPELVQGFLEDAKNVFKEDLTYNSYKKRTDGVQVVELSARHGRAVAETGIRPGRKVENNQGIPEFIFKLNNKKIAEFLSQLVDDEGCINLTAGHIKMNFGLIASENESHLMHGLEELFARLGILVSIYKQGIYKRIHAEDRRRWQLQIHGGFQIQKLAKLLKLRHKEKARKLPILAQSFKSIMYLRRNCHQIYVNHMQEIILQKGHFTSEDLIKPLDRKVGHIRNMLNKFLKKGLIVQIEPSKLTSAGSLPAKYVVSNEIYSRLPRSQQICASH